MQNIPEIEEVTRTVPIAFTTNAENAPKAIHRLASNNIIIPTMFTGRGNKPTGSTNKTSEAIDRT